MGRGLCRGAAGIYPPRQGSRVQAAAPAEDLRLSALPGSSAHEANLGCSPGGVQKDPRDPSTGEGGAQAEATSADEPSLSRGSGSSHHGQSPPGIAAQTRRGKFSGASRRRGALRCRGGWHGLAATG
jgi:hypothetical protein